MIYKAKNEAVFINNKRILKLLSGKLMLLQIQKNLNPLVKILIVVLFLELVFNTLEETKIINPVYLNWFHCFSAFFVFIIVVFYCTHFISNPWIKYLIPTALFFLFLHTLIAIVEELPFYQPIQLFGISFDYLDAIQDPLPLFIISCFLIAFYKLIEHLETQNFLIQQEMVLREIELKEKERLLQEKETAEKANNTKSLFLANMSHEIRTPLNGVLGILEILKETPLSDEQTEHLALAEASGKTLLAIVNDVLDYSKIEAGKLVLNKTEFNLQSLLKTILQPLSIQIQTKGLSFKMDLHPNLPQYVLGDQFRLSQIITNLISNAIKFTKDGIIEFQAKPIDTNERFTSIRFVVKDSGIGIATESQLKIFDMFYQIEDQNNSAYKGPGLGLAICSQLVKMMNGTIGVNSTVGNGSEFWFTIPYIMIQKSYANDAMETVDTSSIHFSANALLIEDNPVNQIVASTMLESAGINVDTVENGLAGVNAFQSHVYDFILMDCQMPVMDGYEATAKIRQWQEQESVSSRTLSKRVPIIAMTAHAFSGEREKCIRAGMDDYLTKPFTYNELIQTILKWVPYQMIEKGKKENHTGSNLLFSAYGNSVLSEKERYNTFNAIEISYLQTIQEIDKSKSSYIVMNTIEAYFDHSSKLIQNMYQYLNERNYKGLSNMGHSLHSCSLNLGAVQLSELCKQLEIHSTGQDDQVCAQLIEQIEDEYATVKMELRKILLLEENLSV